MNRLIVFIIGMVGLCGAMSENGNWWVNVTGLIMFGAACLLGVIYADRK